MRRFAFVSIASSVALFAIASATCLSAQGFTTGPCPQNYSGSYNVGHPQERLCEARSATLPLSGGQLRVKGSNGGIEVLGEDRSDIALEARVDARAPTQAEAQSLMREIRIITAGTITAEGPQGTEDRNWSVSYHLRVPRRLSAELLTANGALKLSSLEGDIHAQTTNGGVSLTDLAGDVHVTTTNGGVSLALNGSAWQGRGLVVRSTNGGLHVKLPASYSAHLLAQTNNGGISGHFPNEPGGRRHNTLDTVLNAGGPTLDLGTTNGGISFSSN